LGLRERNVWTGLVVLGLLLAPAVLDPVTTMAYGQQMVALAIIFVSIVAITGLSGHITLGQAAFAGIGAFGSARLSNALHLPIVVGMVGGGLMAVVAGVIAGFPALRRKGLFLALTTLAFGLLIYNFVLQSTNFAGGYNGLQVRRPELFSGQRAFYYFELACLGLSVLLARNLRSGRLGRILGAMRDSEAGAASLGVDLRAYKLFIFGASAFLAGIGGALLAQKSQSYSAFDFHPITASLVWFTVVVVTRVDAISGGVVGAVVFVMLDVVLKRPGISLLVIGLAALFLGRLPGGNLLGLFAWARDRFVRTARTVASAGAAGTARARVPGSVARAPSALGRASGARPDASVPRGARRPDLVPSTYARRILAGLPDPS
jgi:branched-chain amino acid transport system permease protein